MREIFTNEDFTKVGYYKSVLDSEGIPSFIRNGLGNNLPTGMPCSPTLCVENDDDYDRAMEILKSIHKPQQNESADWVCKSCSETVPGTFDTCWNCGQEPALRRTLS